MKAASKWSIYGLFDAEKPDEIRYVGQTANLRVRIAVHLASRDQATWEWVKSTRESGGVISTKVFQICQDKAEANKAEREWVAKFDNLLNKNLNGKTAFEVPVEELIPLRELEARYVHWAKRTFKNDAQFLMRALGMTTPEARRHFSETEVEKWRASWILEEEDDQEAQPEEPEKLKGQAV